MFQINFRLFYISNFIFLLFFIKVHWLPELSWTCHASPSTIEMHLYVLILVYSFTVVLIDYDRELTNTTLVEIILAA